MRVSAFAACLPLPLLLCVALEACLGDETPRPLPPTGLTAAWQESRDRAIAACRQHDPIDRSQCVESAYQQWETLQRKWRADLAQPSVTNTVPDVSAKPRKRRKHR